MLPCLFAVFPFPSHRSEGHVQWCIVPSNEQRIYTKKSIINMKDLLKKISTLSLLVTTLLSGNLWVEARTIPTQIHSNRASVQQFNNPVSIGAVVRAIEV